MGEPTDYHALVDAGAKRFNVWGPNSGGWEGYLCLNGMVWEVRADHAGVELGAHRTYRAFMERYDVDAPPGGDRCDYSDVIAFIRGELDATP